MRTAVLIVPAFVAFSSAVAADDPAKIPLVKTWKELHDLPPIDLGGGVKVRLGLEAAQIPQWSGVLLYCLTEGYTPGSSGSDRALGPVFADYRFVASKKREGESKGGREKRGWRKGFYLFTHALAVDRVRAGEITVTDREGKVLAKGVFEGTKDFFHPWMPWFHIRGMELISEPVPARGIALPRVNKSGPIAFAEYDKLPSDRLPTLWPTDNSPTMSAITNGKMLLVRSEKGFPAAYPEFHFLARWWVNDKPFVPEQLHASWHVMRQGLDVHEKELELPLSFEPELIGAKPGDKISLQLLYCENEWGWCTLRMCGGREEWNIDNLRLSNRVNFVAGPSRKESSGSEANVRLRWEP